MKTLVPSRPLVLRRFVLRLLLCLAVGSPGLAPGLRAADPGVGALTLEPSPFAGMFRLGAPAPGQTALRDTAGRRLLVREDDPYDRNLSDSFTRHDYRPAHRATLPDAEGMIPLDAGDSFGTSERPPVSAARQEQKVEDAPAALPEPVRPADYAASGFAAAGPATSGYSHARFAADMLAAPARTRLAAEAHPAWLDDSPAPTTPAALAGRVPPSFAVPAWTAAPGASFAPAAYASPVPASGAWVASLPAAPLPAALGNSQSVAYGWGNNSSGQQGSTTANGVNTGINTPTQITAVPGGVSTVAAGGAFGLILRSGSVYAAGNNFYGQLGSTTNNGSSSAANPTPTLVGGLPAGATTAIAAGNNFSLAVANGNVYAFGNNNFGQLGNGTNAGNANANPTPTLVGGLSGVTAVAAGGSHSLAITGGNVYAFGLNNNGQLGNTTNNGSGVANTTANPTPALVGGLPAGVTRVAAGTAHSLALVNGSVYAWGWNQYGQLGNTTNNQAGANVATSTPARVSGLPAGVTAIAAGGNFSLAVANGNVFSWGFNGNGQLGNGTTSGTTVANPVPYEVQFNGTNLGGIVALAAGSSSSYALATDGSLYVWGGNANGQLGLGNTTPYTTPQHLLPPSGQYYQFIDSDGGGAFALAIVGDAPVPEPATWTGGALLLGAAGLTLRRRLRRARAVRA